MSGELFFGKDIRKRRKWFGIGIGVGVASSSHSPRVLEGLKGCVELQQFLFVE